MGWSIMPISLGMLRGGDGHTGREIKSLILVLSYCSTIMLQCSIETVRMNDIHPSLTNPKITAICGPGPLGATPSLYRSSTAFIWSQRPYNASSLSPKQPSTSHLSSSYPWRQLPTLIPSLASSLATAFRFRVHIRGAPVPDPFCGHEGQHQ